MSIHEITSAQFELAIEQINSARQYSLSLIEDIDESDWFVQPGGSPTHVAWEVGHLAMAEYGLGLFRQRGRVSEDTELMPSRFRKAFQRGSTPSPDPESYPTPSAIVDTLNQVHSQFLVEREQWTLEELQQEIDQPYAVYPNRLGALLFCAHHEMLHAGQIGLLRRLLGKDPVR